MSIRMGVDVGGTFTDIVVSDDTTGEIRVGKVPTVTGRPDEGVLNSVSAVFGEETAPDASYFLHGTTVGLNALLQRSGAKIGLLATDGFRDVLEIRRGDRVDPNRLLAEPIRPLVPRRLRLAVKERILADGSVHTPLDPGDVEAALRVFEEHGVEVVVIAFINAYANPEHELAAARELERLGFEGEITLSHRISGEYREYERTSTTVVDAFVRPLTRHYLTRLEDALRGSGLEAELLMTRPDGGAITFAEAADRPFETILSGPVGGVQGAAELARRLDLGDVITADVGGTSFDTALVSDGSAHLMYEGHVVGMPIQTAWVDVRSIGAGGGSVAYVDEGGLLRVGPRSAGALPGPACYGRGGTEPTVTDAAFLLGMLPNELASGLKLSRELAEEAIAPVAMRLGLDLHSVARGIMVIVTAAMGGAMREITIEQGFDPRGAKLMPFGGAGPLFGTLLASELEIRELVIPPYAGNFSAWGMLGADLVRSQTRSRVLRLDERALETVNEIVEELFGDLEARVSDGSERRREIALDMRYRGQEHTITVTVPSEDGRVDTSASDAIAQLFTDTYSSTYSYTLDADPEIVTMRTTIRESLGTRKVAAVGGNGGSGADRGKRSTFSFVENRWMDFAMVDASTLLPHAEFEGPALIIDETSTIYVDAGFNASVDQAGALRLRNTRL